MNIRPWLSKASPTGLLPSAGQTIKQEAPASTSAKVRDIPEAIVWAFGIIHVREDVCC